MTSPTGSDDPEAATPEGGHDGTTEPGTSDAVADPRATSHPAGEQQANKNAQNEPAG